MGFAVNFSEFFEISRNFYRFSEISVDLYRIWDFFIFHRAFLDLPHG